MAFSTEKLKKLFQFWEKNYDLLIIVIISEWVSDDGGILFLSNLIPMVAAVEFETHTEFWRKHADMIDDKLFLNCIQDCYTIEIQSPIRLGFETVCKIPTKILLQKSEWNDL